MDVKGSAGFISNIRINGKPIPQYKLTDKFEKHTKEARDELIAFRSTVTDRISNYISEEVGSAFGTKVTTANTAKFKEATGTKGDAAPDFQVDIPQFAPYFGIPISQTQAIQAEAQGTAFVETKVKIHGEGGDFAISAPSVSGRLGLEQNELSPNFGKPKDPTTIAAAIFKQAGTTPGGGPAGIGPKKSMDILWGGRSLGLTDSAKTEWDANAKKVKAVAVAKVENLFFVNINDAQKSGRRVSLMFKPNVLIGKATTRIGFEKNFTVRIKYRAGKKDSYRMEIAPTNELQQKLKASGRDVTKKVAQLHMETHSRKFHKGLMAYLIKSLIATYAETGPEAVAKALGFAVAFAEEFRKGGLTPFTIKTDIVVPLPFKKVTQNITMKRAEAHKPLYLEHK